MRYLAALALIVAPLGAARPASLHLVRIGQFDHPVFVAAARSEPGRIYVVEKTGRIVVAQNGRTRAAPFLDIHTQVSDAEEQGLLSMAFDPRYAQNHRFYVDFTDTNGDTRVVRYTSNGTSAIPSSAKQLLFVKDFAPNHNGGQLEFGPDGRLWWGNGDGGDEGDPQHNGQNLSRPFSKLMTLDVNAARPRWHMVAYGLRNPWRFSFDRANGDLYIGDVGQDNYEEIDYLRHGFTQPVNFGWRRFEGNHVFDSGEKLAGRGRYVPPVVEYPHSAGCSVSGGYVYRGKAVPAAAGRYFYGDYCSGTVWSFVIRGGRAAGVRAEPFTVKGLSTFGEDAAGELYLASVDEGSVYRLAG